MTFSSAKKPWKLPVNSKLAKFLLLYYLLLLDGISLLPMISAVEGHSRGEPKEPNRRSDGGGVSLKTADLTAQELEDFKRNFLTKLGLKSRIEHLKDSSAKNQIISPLQVPEYLWDIYDRILEENPGQFDDGESFEFSWGSETNTIRNLFSDSEEPFQNADGGSGLMLTFNLTGIPAQELLTEAELRLEISKNLRRRARVSISEVIDSCRNIFRLLDTRIIPVSHGFDENSVIFDVLPGVRRTLQTGTNRTLTFFVDVQDATGRPVKNLSDWLVFSAAGNSISRARPALLLYSADGAQAAAPRAHRVKRRTGGRARKRGRNHRGGRKRHGGSKKKLLVRNNLCRKRSLYVDFRELNWQDWILAPSGYEAYYCSGICEYPIVDSQNTTNHAVVQSLVNSVTPGVVPPPCCVPTEMSAISMLYIDIDNRIVIKNYPEMIVQGCGCR